MTIINKKISLGKDILSFPLEKRPRHDMTINPQARIGFKDDLNSVKRKIEVALTLRSCLTSANS